MVINQLFVRFVWFGINHFQFIWISMEFINIGRHWSQYVRAIIITTRIPSNHQNYWSPNGKIYKLCGTRKYYSNVYNFKRFPVAIQKYMHKLQNLILNWLLLRHHVFNDDSKNDVIAVFVVIHFNTIIFFKAQKSWASW